MNFLNSVSEITIKCNNVELSPIIKREINDFTANGTIHILSSFI